MTEQTPPRRIQVDLRTIPEAPRKTWFRPSLEQVLQLTQLVTVVGGILGALVYFHDDRELKAQQVNLQHQQLALQEQQLGLNRLELQEKSAYRVEVSSSLTTSCREGRPSCGVRFKMTFPNRGPVPVVVAENSVALYLGADEHSDAAAAPVRLPGDVGGAVVWGAQVAGGSYRATLGGGNTGRILPGEATTATYDYAVRVHRGDWIAVQARLAVQPDAEEAGPTSGGRSEIVTAYCQIGGRDPWRCPNAEEKDDAGAAN
jgi:hypothetical protein